MDHSVKHRHFTALLAGAEGSKGVLKFYYADRIKLRKPDLEIKHYYQTLERVINGNLTDGNGYIGKGRVPQNLAYLLSQEYSFAIGKVSERSFVPPKLSYEIKDEITLFNSMNYHIKKIRHYSKKILNKNTKKGYRNETISLVKSYENARFWREIIAEKNIGLIHHMAKLVKKRNPYRDYKEIWEFGLEAYNKSIIGFDITRGLKFSTYACNGILKGMIGCIRKEINHEARIENMKKHLAENPQKDNHKNGEGSLAINIEDLLFSSELDDRSMYIIIERYLNSEEKTLEHVGIPIKISKERVRQVQNNSLNKIRSHLEKNPDLLLKN